MHYIRRRPLASRGGEGDRGCKEYVMYSVVLFMIRGRGYGTIKSILGFANRERY
jgi:hypothetical protein